MTSRERVIAAIEFSGPDRVPHRNAFLPAVFRKYGRKVEELLRRFPSDFAGEDGPPEESTFSTGETTDEWGACGGYYFQGTGPSTRRVSPQALLDGGEARPPTGQMEDVPERWLDEFAVEAIRRCGGDSSLP